MVYWLKKVILATTIILITAVSNVYAADDIYVVPTGSTATYNRMCGNSRYETAVAIAKNGWQQADYAIIASGENYPDALAAAPLAKKYDAPILLTNKDSLNDATKQCLEDLKVKQCLIVGGNGAVSSDVENAINSLGIQTTRLAGSDRYDTAIQIANQLDNVNSIAVVTGNSYGDALSIGSEAGINNMPIILMPKDYIPDSVKNYLANHNIQKSYIVGSVEEVNVSVGEQFPNPERIDGPNAYTRNIFTIYRFDSDYANNETCLATGTNFADALAGTAYAVKKGIPIVLIPNGDYESIHSYMFGRERTDKTVDILGGEGVISNNTVDSYVKGIPNLIPQQTGVAPMDYSEYSDVLPSDLKNFIDTHKDANITDLQKIKAWAEFCMANYSYDYDYYNNKAPKKDLFKDHKGICADFAGLTVDIAKWIGIEAPCEYCGGFPDHNWAQFEINGETFVFEGTASKANPELVNDALGDCVLHLDHGVTYIVSSGNAMSVDDMENFKSYANNGLSVEEVIYKPIIMKYMRKVDLNTITLKPEDEANLEYELKGTTNQDIQVSINKRYYGKFNQDLIVFSTDYTIDNHTYGGTQFFCSDGSPFIPY